VPGVEGYKRREVENDLFQVAVALRPQAPPPRRFAANGWAGTWVVPGVEGYKRRKVENDLCQVIGRSPAGPPHGGGDGGWPHFYLCLYLSPPL